MSNELLENSELDLVDKIAVATVLLLAGLFLWQFLENEETPLSYTSRTQQVDDTDSKIKRIKGRLAVAEVESQQIQEIRQPLKETPRLQVKETDVAPVKQIANVAVAPVIEEVQEAVVAPVAPEPVEIVKVVTPTIRPVSSDLSQGALELSGTGEPGSYLQLVLNGVKTSKIEVDANGEWLYATNLEPGDYSVQVLSPALNEQMNKQSAETSISIPHPPAPKPIKIEEKKEVVPEEVSVIQELEAVARQIEEQKIEPVPAKVVETVIPEVRKVVAEKIIPPAKKKAVANDNYYKVKYGDTLNKLSRRFGVTLRNLVRANNIADKDVIEVGQRLIIPGHYTGND